MDYYMISKILTVILVFVTLTSAYTTYRLRLISMLLSYELHDCVVYTSKKLELLSLQARSYSMLQKITELDRKNKEQQPMIQEKKTIKTKSIPFVESEPIVPMTLETSPLDEYFSKKSILLPHTSGI